MSFDFTETENGRAVAAFRWAMQSHVRRGDQDDVDLRWLAAKMLKHYPDLTLALWDDLLARLEADEVVGPVRTVTRPAGIYLNDPRSLTGLPVHQIGDQTWHFRAIRRGPLLDWLKRHPAGYRAPAVSPAPSLDGEEWAILAALAEAHPVALAQDEIEGKARGSDGEPLQLSRTTIYRRLAKTLRPHGLTRPRRGGGEEITEQGLALVRGRMKHG
jgi:hypothetical protein